MTRPFFLFETGLEGESFSTGARAAGKRKGEPTDGCASPTCLLSCKGLAQPLSKQLWHCGTAPTSGLQHQQISAWGRRSWNPTPKDTKAPLYWPLVIPAHSALPGLFKGTT